MNSPKIIIHSDQSIATTAARDAEIIRSLTGKRNPSIGYIPSTPDARRKYFSEKQKYYEKCGFTNITYCDPEENNSNSDIASFFERDLIHLSGGEVVSFMHRLRNTGFDSQLQDFSARGGVLLGVSAGAMLLGKTFTTASLFGEKGSFEGLGFFDFELVPHTNEHFPRLDILEAFARKSRKTVFALNDGDVITISGSKIKMYGAPVKLEPKQG